jgi:hypothetical protein
MLSTFGVSGVPPGDQNYETEKRLANDNGRGENKKYLALRARACVQRPDDGSLKPRLREDRYSCLG